MSLKSKLRELMRAYLTSQKAWVSEQAAPSGAPVVIASENGTYTAPSDGYILARAQATDENGWVDISSGIGATSVLKSADQNAQVFVPIRKGEAAVVNFGASMTNKVVAFVSTVGEGGKPLVRPVLEGGLLCRLSPTCEVPLRAGAGHTEAYQITTRLSPWMQEKLHQGARFITRRLVMVTSSYLPRIWMLPLTLKQNSAHCREILSPYVRQAFPPTGQLAPCPCRKATQSAWATSARWLQVFSSSFTPTSVHNFVLGGVA